jgi:calcineurin-like phosphoesterase family protein
MIYVTADLHLCHDKEFMYGPRGFNSIQEHDKEVIKRINSTTEQEDTLYVLGDVMLNDNELAMEYLSQIHCKLIFLFGNHDTLTRQKLLSDKYETVGYATMLKYKKYSFYLSHYPTLTSNYDDKALYQRTINLCGHTHTQDKFADMDKGYIYHTELDAHNCYPVSIDQIIEDLKNYEMLKTK